MLKCSWEALHENYCSLWWLSPVMSYVKVHILLNQKNLTADKCSYHIVLGFSLNGLDSCLKVKYGLWRRNWITFFEKLMKLFGSKHFNLLSNVILDWVAKFHCAQKNPRNNLEDKYKVLWIQWRRYSWIISMIFSRFWKFLISMMVVFTLLS